MSDDAWTILGLAPGAERAAIKRAYAVLLKQHRPDQDPEGFRRIRDAYEWLIARAGSAPSAPSMPLAPPAEDAAPPVPVPVPSKDGQPSSVSPPMPEPPAAEFPAPQPAPATRSAPAATIDRSMPGIWELRVAELASAAALPAGAAREGAVLTAVQALTALAGTGAGLAAWSQALMRHLGDDPGSLARAISDEALAREALDGPGRIARLVCEELFRARDWDRLRSFAGRWLGLLDGCASLSSPAAGLTRHLALCLALADYPLTSRLCEHLQRQVGGRGRMQIDPELDTSLLMGSALRHLPDDVRAYIDRTLFTPMRWWDEPALYRRAHTLLRALPADSPVRGWLRGRAPQLYGFLAATQGVVLRATLLSVLMYALAFVIAIIGTTVILAQPQESPLIRDGTVTGIVVTAVWIVAFVGGWWLNRRLEDWFYRRLWTPIDRHAGPLDLTFCLWSLWVLLGIGSIPLSYWNPDPRWSAPLWLGSPFLLAVPFARLRRFLDPRHGGDGWRRFLPSADVLGEFRSLVGRAHYDAGSLIATLVRAIPALLIAAMVIGSLALNPALGWEDGAHDAARGMFWTGPAAALAIACHAWFIAWYRRRPRRWRPLGYWMTVSLVVSALVWGVGILAMRHLGAHQPLPAALTVSALLACVWLACRRAP
jgi:hypothetical protein